MDQNGLKWTNIDQNGLKWTNMNQYDNVWLFCAIFDYFGFFWTILDGFVPFWTIWGKIGQFGQFSHNCTKKNKKKFWKWHAKRTWNTRVSNV